MRKEKWFVSNKKADFAAISEKYQITPITARLLRNRGITTEQEITAFLYGTERDLHTPLLMKDMKQAVQILKEKIVQKKKLYIVADYDVDGCMSGCILLCLLKALGADVSIDIPDRIKDGYGMNIRIVEEAYKKGADTIITCDNGIAAREAVKRAKDLQMTVLVTDHHDVPFETQEDGSKVYHLPEADAIVNPKQPGDPYPFSLLCGASVCYKLAEAMTNGFQKEQELQKELLQFAAIATICDIVDLQGENRILVKLGLSLLQKTKNPGLLALCEVNKILPETLSYYHIGFILGPCINASGRLETAKKAVALFLTKDRNKAECLALELKQLNDSRKTLTEQGVKEAIAQIERTDWEKKKVFVLYLPDCHESVAGIIAGRLRERYNHPIYVLTNAKEKGMLKGSGRSVAGYHMFQGLLQMQEHLERFGGHPMAAGVTLCKDKLQIFDTLLNQNCMLQAEDFAFKITIDVPLAFEHITKRFIQEISFLEPFGKGNPKPVFAQKSVLLLRARVLGKNRNVLKLLVRNESGVVLDGIYFGNIEEFEAFVIEKYDKAALDCLYTGKNSSVSCDLIYYPEINQYQGKESIQILISSFR